MQKVLGLDLGTNSLGWAIIETSGNGRCRLLQKGVDIFQEGVKIEKGVESSKAAERTVYRSTRRRLYRRKVRKIETLKVLTENEMCPPLSAEPLSLWRTKNIYPDSEDFIAWQRTYEQGSRNPYYCRYRALNLKLDLEQQTDRYLLGRAFYHLAQRRGFLSNRRESAKGSDGIIKSQIGKLSHAMEDAGCQYLGEFFFQCYEEGTKIRCRHTSRKEHYLKEFNAICDKQEIPEPVRKKLERAIFFQRPLKSQKNMVGRCTFEKNKSRCHITHPRYEEFRMWSFINNIKVKTPSDKQMRPLSDEEVRKILPLFMRKSKAHFTFEEVAKKLAGKGKYACVKDKQSCPCQFNFSMTTSVSGCPVTAQLVDILGEDWKEKLNEFYIDKGRKTIDEIVNDIWHVLFSFDDEAKLAAFATNKLGLDRGAAEKFSKIKMGNSYATLSLNAIDKMLPYLRSGFLYSHAVFLANLKKVFPVEVWNNQARRKEIINDVISAVNLYGGDQARSGNTLESYVRKTLEKNYALSSEDTDKLYHPSVMESRHRVQQDSKGRDLLGSPRTDAIRNPMAMRSLFRLRKLINQLIASGIIDKQTKIHIELSRGLNDANKRKALEQFQRNREKARADYIVKIKDLYNPDYEPTPDDLLKYQLWEEQDHRCVYTGHPIDIHQFMGGGSEFEIEFTIPRSRGGDNSQMNKTLCHARFNREKKLSKIPAQLANHAEILERIKPWKEKYEELARQIEKIKGNFLTKERKDMMVQRRHRLRMEMEYWKGRYMRFVMEEVPDGFSKTQSVDIGVISKYARAYLKAVFPNVYVVKGTATAEFRKMWGLQEAEEAKERTNHIHHCIDAVTIACIGREEYDRLAHYFHQQERNKWCGDVEKPQFPKPWKTFTEDMQTLGEDVLVSHHTPDNMSKQTKKKLRRRGKILYNPDGKVQFAQGDSARGSLHQNTFYGAIMHKGAIKYVVRRSLEQLGEGDIKNIVDKVVRRKIEETVREKGFKQAIAEPIWMNLEKGVRIKKVRCYTHGVSSPLHIRTHRDLSRHQYKHQYHVANDSNYMMAIYEGIDKNGRTRRQFEIVSNMAAANFHKRSNSKVDSAGIVSSISSKDYAVRCVVKSGTMVLFWENSPEEIWRLDKTQLQKRLYKVIGLSRGASQSSQIGNMMLKHHQEARPTSQLQVRNGAFNSQDEYRPIIKIMHTQFNALVEGRDFELSTLGEIKRLMG